MRWLSLLTITEYNFQVLETLRVCFTWFIAPPERLFDDGGLALLDLKYAAFDGVINLEEGWMDSGYWTEIKTHYKVFDIDSFLLAYSVHAIDGCHQSQYGQL